MAIQISGTTVIDNSKNFIGTGLSISGISTVANFQITPVGTGATVGGSTGIVTYYGDGQYLQNVAAVSGGGGNFFNSGITSITTSQLVGLGTVVLALPSTSGKRYIIHSINASNVAVGNTDVNVIGAFDFAGGQRSYFAYNIPIPTGAAVELLKQPQILNPYDQIVMRGTDFDRVGSDDAVQVYVTYEEKTDTDYFGVGIGSVGIGSTAPAEVYTSTTYPSVLQSIRLANTTDTGDYPVSVTITSGVVTTYLVDDLIIPRYGSVELLDTPKAIKTNDVVSVIVDQLDTINVQISGIKVV